MISIKAANGFMATEKELKAFAKTRKEVRKKLDQLISEKLSNGNNSEQRARS